MPSSVGTITRKENEQKFIRIDQPAMEIMGNHDGLDWHSILTPPKGVEDGIAKSQSPKRQDLPADLFCLMCTIHSDARFVNIVML